MTRDSRFSSLRMQSVRLCWLSLGLGMLVSVATQAAEPPNVLLLICDDLNCDLGTYGHPLVKTPNIDRLANRGVQFNRAYCQYPLCGPSRASFMTGMYCDQTLVRRNAIYLREHLPNVRTIAQTFRAADYFSTRIGKIFHYNVPKHIGTSGHDDPYSWNYTINPRGRDKADEDKIFSLTPGSFGGTLSWLAADGADEEQTDGIAATQAAALLSEYAESKQRFFLAVGLYRPHTPFVAPKKYFEQYPLDVVHVPQVPDGYLETLPPPAVKSVTRKKQQVDLEPALAKQALQAYYASISFADAQIGRILDALEKHELADNTIVLFTSDHGYHMGEHGHWQKSTLFENAARVPLIMAGPGISDTGQTSDALVEMVDFHPTLADLAGIEAPATVSGVSLVPVLREPQQSVRESAFTQYENGYSIRTQRYRFTAWGQHGELGRELYDHQQDPRELVNLAGQAATTQVENELALLLQRRIAAGKSVPAGLKQITRPITRSVPQPFP